MIAAHPLSRSHIEVRLIGGHSAGSSDLVNFVALDFGCIARRIQSPVPTQGWTGNPGYCEGSQRGGLLFSFQTVVILKSQVALHCLNRR